MNAEKNESKMKSESEKENGGDTMEQIIVTDQAFDEQKFQAEVEKLGYKVLGITRKPYEK